MFAGGHPTIVGGWLKVDGWHAGWLKVDGWHAGWLKVATWPGGWLKADGGLGGWKKPIRTIIHIKKADVVREFATKLIWIKSNSKNSRYGQSFDCNQIWFESNQTQTKNILAQTFDFNQIWFESNQMHDNV